MVVLVLVLVVVMGMKVRVMAVMAVVAACNPWRRCRRINSGVIFHEHEER